MTDPTTDLQTERTTVKRVARRGAYDVETVHSILDDSYVCHVGIVVDDVPIVVPTLHARRGDELLLHGSPASRMLRTAKTQEISVTATIVDGFVLARSAFHHSINYRSVTVIGRPSVVPDADKPAALDHLMEVLTPGRNPFLRPMTDTEVRATTVLSLPITEASAKIRTGPPGDDDEDYDLPIWAGIVPVTEVFGAPETDPAMRMEVDVPDHVRRFRTA